MTDLFSVAGKRVLVTGGSRGIGRMIAAGFVAAGASVTIASRDPDRLEATAAELRADGDCTAVVADLSTMDGVRALAGAVTQQLDVLVNNAGVTWGAPVAEYPDERWDGVVATNLRGVFYLTARLQDALLAAGTPDDPARVINIGSVDGLRVSEWENYAYSASKAGVHMLTRQLARRLASAHITVNAIAPGLFESRMTAFVLDEDEKRAQLAAKVPMGRIGRPDDIVGASLFLASRAGSYLTGAVIPVDGGLAA